MTREELTDTQTIEDSAVFLEPGNIFDKGIIGISSDGLHVIYDYEKLAAAFTEDGYGEDEAREWLDYNTLPCLPLMGEGKPVVIFPVNSDV